MDSTALVLAADDLAAVGRLAKLIVGAFVVACLLVWLYLGLNPGEKPREDDLGSTPRDLDEPKE